MTATGPMQTPAGVMPLLQPYCPINLTTESFWTIVAHVNRALKQRGLHAAAAEFRSYVEHLDQDSGHLLMIAMAYVRVISPEEELHYDGRG